MIIKELTNRHEARTSFAEELKNGSCYFPKELVETVDSYIAYLLVLNGVSEKTKKGQEEMERIKIERSKIFLNMTTEELAVVTDPSQSDFCFLERHFVLNKWGTQLLDGFKNLLSRISAEEAKKVEAKRNEVQKWELPSRNTRELEIVTIGENEVVLKGRHTRINKVILNRGNESQVVMEVQAIPEKNGKNETRLVTINKIKVEP